MVKTTIDFPDEFYIRMKLHGVKNKKSIQAFTVQACVNQLEKETKKAKT